MGPSSKTNYFSRTLVILTPYRGGQFHWRYNIASDPSTRADVVHSLDAVAVSLGPR